MAPLKLSIGAHEHHSFFSSLLMRDPSDHGQVNSNDLSFIHTFVRLLV